MGKKGKEMSKQDRLRQVELFRSRARQAYRDLMQAQSWEDAERLLGRFRLYQAFKREARLMLQEENSIKRVDRLSVEKLGRDLREARDLRRVQEMRQL